MFRPSGFCPSLSSWRHIHTSPSGFVPQTGTSILFHNSFPVELLFPTSDSALLTSTRQLQLHSWHGKPVTNKMTQNPQHFLWEQLSIPACTHRMLWLPWNGQNRQATKAIDDWCMHSLIQIYLMKSRSFFDEVLRAEDCKSSAGKSKCCFQEISVWAWLNMWRAFGTCISLNEGLGTCLACIAWSATPTSNECLVELVSCERLTNYYASQETLRSY